jgi:hypothetical protein
MRGTKNENKNLSARGRLRKAAWKGLRGGSLSQDCRRKTSKCKAMPRSRLIPPHNAANDKTHLRKRKKPASLTMPRNAVCRLPTSHPHSRYLGGFWEFHSRAPRRGTRRACRQRHLQKGHRSIRRAIGPSRSIGTVRCKTAASASRREKIVARKSNSSSPCGCARLADVFSCQAFFTRRIGMHFTVDEATRPDLRALASSRESPALA